MSFAAIQDHALSRVLALPPRASDLKQQLHMHPGSDDILVPAPMMSPPEVLALFLDGLRLPPNRDKPREPTAFEVGWFRDTHAALAAPRK